MNDPEDTPMMECEWCGKVFPADAMACAEAGLDACHPPLDGEEWKGDEPVSLPPGHFSSSDRETMKQQMGLDDAQLDQLLETGSVEGFGAIVCVECQDNAAAAMEE